MIRYEPQPRWLPDIVRLPLSYALVRALRGTFGMGVYAGLLVYLLEMQVRIELPHGALAFSALGGVVSLALAFRVNNAYARWWEARQHWGLLVNHSRNLAALGRTLWRPDDEPGRRRLAGLIGDFAVGLSLHLRGELTPAELPTLSDAEREEAGAREHPLSLVSQLLWAEAERRRAEGLLDTAQLLTLQPHLRAPLDVLGACERIRSTPIPFAVTSAARLFLLLFALFVPIGLHGEFSWAAIPIGMAAYFAVAVMDVLAAELENPFGIDCNDLPTRSIGEMIRRQAHEILGVEREGPADTQPTKPALYTKIR